jgi:hypothetical protein
MTPGGGEPRPRGAGGTARCPGPVVPDESFGTFRATGNGGAS